MSKLIRCPACLGKKIVKGLGSIEKKCRLCAGIGFVEEPTEEEIATIRTEDEQEILEEEIFEEDIAPEEDIPLLSATIDGYQANRRRGRPRKGS